jgi:hypothetical protein
LREAGPFSGQLVFSKDRFDRTLRNARVTVYAGLGINHQHVIIQMKCVDRTDEGAIGVATVYAGFSNDVGHQKSASRCDAVIASLEKSKLLMIQPDNIIKHESRKIQSPDWQFF